jgi:uncharacterized protein involved in exopolysaccharide biosynthesis
MSNNTQQIQEDEIDLRELFKTIWDKKVFIIVFTTLITIVSLIYVFSLKPIYEVKSVVRIGFIDKELVEESNIVEKKLRNVFNVDSKSRQNTNSESFVSSINTIKNVKNFLEITTEGLSTETALEKNKEVIRFLKDEYKYKIEEYLIDRNLEISRIKERINYTNKVEKINLIKQIEKVRDQSIPKIDQKITSIKNTELKLINNKLKFNSTKLKEYELNLLKISNQKSTDNTQNMLMAMQILNTQNLILSLQNTIENLKKEKENLNNIVLKDLEIQKDNLINDTVRKLQIKLDVDLKNKLSNLNNQLNAKINNLKINVKNSEIIGDFQVSDYPIKPKKKLIVVVSFVTGFILSIFLVFFMQFIRSMKEDKV